MLGDITATWKFQEEADKFGEDAPEWDDPDFSEARKYAEVARHHLIDAGCIFAKPRIRPVREMSSTSTGLADVLKRSFDFCVELADDC